MGSLSVRTRGPRRRTGGDVVREGADAANAAARLTLLGLSGALLGLAGPLHGQSDEEVQERYLLPVPAADEDGRLRVRLGWTVPAMGGNSPTGYGADWGVVFAVATFQERTRQSDRADGTAAGGFGLGNARDLVGLEVRVHSFSTVRSYPFDTGAVDLHLHRQLPAGFAVAAGWESVVHWGGGDSGSNRYGVLSKWFTLNANPRAAFSALSLSAGVGDGRFQRVEAWRAGEDGVGVFGSMALRVAAPVSVVADWTGQDLLLAASVAPFPDLGFVVTGGAADVAGEASDGARFVMSASLGHDFGGR